MKFETIEVGDVLSLRSSRNFRCRCICEVKKKVHRYYDKYLKVKNIGYSSERAFFSYCSKVFSCYKDNCVLLYNNKNRRQENRIQVLIEVENV